MADRQKAVRAWAGRACYPGLDPFMVGTVFLPWGTMQHEVDAALAELWSSISPHPAPPMEAVAGMVFFVPEDGA